MAIWHIPVGYKHKIPPIILILDHTNWDSQKYRTVLGWNHTTTGHAGEKSKILREIFLKVSPENILNGTMIRARNSTNTNTDAKGQVILYYKYENKYL